QVRSVIQDRECPDRGSCPAGLTRSTTRACGGYIVGVLDYKWTSKLTHAMETDHAFDPEVLGYVNSPYVPHSAACHGFVNRFLYEFTEKVSGVWRSEIFRDPYGLATGNADTYHEITRGLVYNSGDHIWIRPEVRYDWVRFTHSFNDGTRSSP